MTPRPVVARGTAKILQVVLPIELHRDLRILALRKGTSLKDLVTETLVRLVLGAEKGE